MYCKDDCTCSHSNHTCCSESRLGNHRGCAPSNESIIKSTAVRLGGGGGWWSGGVKGAECICGTGERRAECIGRAGGSVGAETVTPTKTDGIGVALSKKKKKEKMEKEKDKDWKKRDSAAAIVTQTMFGTSTPRRFVY